MGNLNGTNPKLLALVTLTEVIMWASEMGHCSLFHACGTIVGQRGVKITTDIYRFMKYSLSC